VAHDVEPAGREGRHRRRAHAAVDHADLAEEVARLHDPTLLAVDLDLGLAFQLDVEGVARLALADQGLARGDVHLVALAGDELKLLRAAAREQRHTAERLELADRKSTRLNSSHVS